MPSAKALDGSFRKLTVRTDDGRLHLAYRRGYFADMAGDVKRKPEANALTMAAVHGAPPASQVVFDVRVLAADDPRLRDARLPAGPAGAMKLKAGARRYVADLRIEGRQIAFSQSADGVQHGQLEAVLIAFDAAGKRTNYLDKLYYLDMKPDVYAQAVSEGITARLALDVPAARASLRIVVYDPATDHAGSLETPLDAGK